MGGTEHDGMAIIDIGPAVRYYLSLLGRQGSILAHTQFHLNVHRYPR